MASLTIPFSIWEGDNDFRWDGPVEEKTPPYNIMSTARPRGEEEERKFTLQAEAKPPTITRTEYCL